MNWLGKLSAPASKIRHRRHARFESLENRRVMAASLSADLGTESLVVNSDFYEVRCVVEKSDAESKFTFIARDPEIIASANDQTTSRSAQKMTPGIEGSDIGSGG